MCDLEYHDIDPTLVESPDVFDQIEELYKNCFTGAHKTSVNELIRLGHDSLLARAFVMRVYLYGLQSTRKDGNIVKYLSTFVVSWAELHSLQSSPVSKYAQVIFADCHKKGVGVPIDLQRAFNLYKESATSLYPPALNNVGICYEQGEGVARDKDEGMKWYRRAAEQGYANAMDNLANALHDGEDVADRDGEAIRWYRRAADLGYHRSINTLAGMHMDGDGVDDDDDEAVRWLRRGVAHDSASSHYFLSFCYQHGRGVEVDVVESIRLLKAGADLGDEDAQFRYGAHLLYGLSVEDYERGRFFARVYDAGYDTNAELFTWLIKPNESEGLSYLIAAANQRCGTACEYLAQYYFERYQDYISAYRWLRVGRRCRDNGAECMYLLGLLHFYGIVSICCYNQRTPLTKEALQRVPAEPVDPWQVFPSPPPVWYPHDPRNRISRAEEWRLARRYFLLAREGQCYRASVYLLWLETQGDTVDQSIAQAVYTASSSGSADDAPCGDLSSTPIELDTDRYDREDAFRAACSAPLDCQDLLGPPLTQEGLVQGTDDARYFQVAYHWLQALHTAAAATSSSSSSSSSGSSEPLSTSPSPRGRGSGSGPPSSSPESLFFAGIPLPEKDISSRLRSFRDHKVGQNFYTVHHHLAAYFAVPGPHQDMLQAIHHLETFQRHFESTFPRGEDDNGENDGGSNDAWYRLRRVAHRRQQGRDQYQRYCQRTYSRVMTEEEAWRVDHSLLPVLHSDCLPLLDGLDTEAEGLCNIGLMYYYGLFYLSSQAKSPTDVAAAAHIGQYWRLDSSSSSISLSLSTDVTATKTADHRHVELHRAIICFRRSAELGNPRAQYCLGWCYRWGEGTHRDRAKAVDWFRASAMQGYARAQFQLGLCYLKGKGVKHVSEEEGWRWITAAAAQQYPEAVKYLSHYRQAASPSR